MKKLLLISWLMCGFQTPPTDTPQAKVRAYRQSHEHQLLAEYSQFLAIPNVASDMPNIGRNTAFIMDMMKQRGLANVQLLESGVDNTPPAVFGEVRTPGATRTITFYAHYDGQPVNPAQWAPGIQPFAPVFLNGSLEKGAKITELPASGQPIDPEWRLYARAAADDKAGVFGLLAAYEALTKTGQKPTANLKFFFEGEEEAGSPHLGQLMARHRELLKTDLWIICDGPVHQSGRKQLSFGVRGDVNLHLTVYGARRPLHSGHYGNWAPNPALRLAKLLASLKDDTGRVLVEGFYDDVDPLTELERQALATVPEYDEEIKKELWLAQTDGGGQKLVEMINLPSLNINGMQSANVGDMAANVIPATATAVLDLRLVRGNDQARQAQKVVAHLKKQGYFVTATEPTEAERLAHPLICKVEKKSGYNAQRTKLDLPIAKLVIAAVQATTKDRLILHPTSGGSLPLYLFEQHVPAPTISVPIVNHDNNQHGENENLRLQNLWDGLETLAAVMLIK